MEYKKNGFDIRCRVEGSGEYAECLSSGNLTATINTSSLVKSIRPQQQLVAQALIPQLGITSKASSPRPKNLGTKPPKHLYQIREGGSVMRFIQQKNIDGGVYYSPATQVSITEQELEWLIEGLDALILPDRAKRIKRALTRALNEIEEAA
jgi:hypothetical protein